MALFFIFKTNSSLLAAKFRGMEFHCRAIYRIFFTKNENDVVDLVRFTGEPTSGRLFFFSFFLVFRHRFCFLFFFVVVLFCCWSFWISTAAPKTGGSHDPPTKLGGSFFVIYFYLFTFIFWGFFTHFFCPLSFFGSSSLIWFDFFLFFLFFDRGNPISLFLTENIFRSNFFVFFFGFFLVTDVESRDDREQKEKKI